ncbi:MAG: hydantoinase/oxoprolinase family protein [Candidatus Hydrothermarchaeota archaeon]
MILGLDVGGANIKVGLIDDEEIVSCRSYYYPLWKFHGNLPNFFLSLKREMEKEDKIHKTGVVMTGELADSFETRKKGVLFIAESLKNAFDEVYFMDYEGVLHDIKYLRENPLNFAGSNFPATVILASRIVEEGILLDMGSTTTDIIPFKKGKHLSGKNDLERLMNEELVYCGFLRTNLCFLSGKVPLRGKMVRISSEYFAQTADIYRILGYIEEEEYVVETPDKRGKSKEDCKRRIARVLCSDKEELAENEILSVARFLKEKQVEMIRSSILNVLERKNMSRNFVLAGIGSVILEEACENVGNIYKIEDEYGREVSAIAPAIGVAYAVRTCVQ